MSDAKRFNTRSEMRRLAFGNPAKFADEYYALQSKLDASQAALKKAYEALGACRQDYIDSQVDGANEDMIATVDKTRAELLAEFPELESK